MRVLFIGATGAVGHQVVPLLQGDFQITSAAIGGGEVAGLPVVDVDITDWTSVQSVIGAGTSGASGSMRSSTAPSPIPGD